MERPTESLTQEERTLLQKFYDDELSPELRGRQNVDKLLAENRLARAYIDTLEFLGRAVHAADDELWERAKAPSPAQLTASVIEESSHVTTDDYPLEMLAPMLERYVDGEVEEVERLVVEDLMASREDVREYVESLRWTANQIRFGLSRMLSQAPDDDAPLDIENVSFDSAAKDVDFSGLWSGIQGRLAAADAGGAADDLQRVILAYDGELDGDVVDESGDEAQASALLDSLKTVTLCANAAHEEMLEGVSFDALYDAVAREIFAPVADVEVSEDVAARSVAGEMDDTAANDDPVAANDNFIQRYRQAIYGALAATLVMGVAILVYFAVANTNQTIIHKTVVVVEDVKYGPGFSGEVVNPIQQVSAKRDAPATNENGEEPTVIWVYDDPNKEKKDDKKEGTTDDEKSSDDTQIGDKQEIKKPVPTPLDPNRNPHGLSI